MISNPELSSLKNKVDNDVEDMLIRMEGAYDPYWDSWQVTLAEIAALVFLTYLITQGL